ncbi:MAG: transglutaminase domain-containing protein [Verrucomicrobia bacterium]|nr:transglutaminase domain-containing protein [Prolixibacteraceae bacterium]
MMKLFYLLILVIALSMACNAQKKSPYSLIESYESIFKRQDAKRQELWKLKEYRKAIAIMQDLRARYEQLDSKDQVNYNGAIQGLSYNLACGYSLVHQIDSSLMYLQLALDKGYDNYYWIKKDSDLVNIRKDKRYEAMMKTRDFEAILKQNCTYKKQSSTVPLVAYQAKEAMELQEFRRKYKLDSVAGNGSEVVRIINLMQWVHRAVRHDGRSYNPGDTHADALIKVCKKEKRGVNCRMMATILNEVYLSMGYPSHFVTCLPKDRNDPDCHVINSVYSKELNKWLWMDPSFETWVKDDKGNLLSIEEVRQRLVNNQPVFASSTYNHNGETYPGAGEQYLHNYMAKNLFQLQIPAVSCAAFESRNDFSSIKLQKLVPVKKFYIQLIPSEFNHQNVPMGELVNGVYYTNDAGQFWRKP